MSSVAHVNYLVGILSFNLQEGRGPEPINLVLSVSVMSRKGFIALFFVEQCLVWCQNRQ